MEIEAKASGALHGAASRLEREFNDKAGARVRALLAEDTGEAERKAADELRVYRCVRAALAELQNFSGATETPVRLALTVEVYPE